jgi:Mg-chelatase subunit ChlD
MQPLPSGLQQRAHRQQRRGQVDLRFLRLRFQRHLRPCPHGEMSLLVVQFLLHSATHSDLWCFIHQQSQSTTYLIKPGVAQQVKKSPMVVFCVDISGSMSTTKHVPEGITLHSGHTNYVSRLDCVKVRNKRKAGFFL